MGFDFDEDGNNDEYGATEGEPTGELNDKPRPPRPEPVKTRPPMTANSLADLVAQMTAPEPPAPPAEPVAQEDLDQAAEEAYMAEVENRLDVASCYKTLLQNPLFDADNPTQASDLVERKVRAFVREQLGILLGVSADKSPAKEKAPLLSEQEVAVVRSLAEMSAIELTAIKLLATSAASKLGPHATPAPAPKPAVPDAPKKAPALAKRPSAPSPVNQGSALPAPQPAQQEQAKRGPGRPPGSKNKPKALVEKKGAVDADGNPILNADGEQIQITNRRVQRPAGALPFPSTNAAMAIATAEVAGQTQLASQRALQQESGAAGTLITAATING